MSKQANEAMQAHLTAVVVPPERQAAIKAEESEAMAALEGLRDWPVNTPQDEESAAELLIAVKSKWRDIDAQRKTITGPLHQAKKAVDALFKPALGFYSDAERILKGKLAEASNRREEAKRAAMMAAQASAAAQDANATHGHLAAARAAEAQQAPAGISFRESWDFEVEDPTAVPLAFKSVDAGKVNAFLDQYKHSETVPAVPGLRFFKRKSVVARNS